MVITKFHVKGVFISEMETDSPLIVYGNRVLAGTIGMQRM
jgi:hypothetical protein